MGTKTNVQFRFHDPMSMTNNSITGRFRSSFQTRTERLGLPIKRITPALYFLLFFCVPFLKKVAGPVYSLAYQLFIVRLLVLKENLYQPRAKLYYILLMVYIATMAFSLLYTSDFVNGVIRLKKQISLTMIPILIETVSSPRHARNYLRAFIFGGAILACMGIYQGIVMHIDRPPSIWNAVHGGNILLFTSVTTVSLLITEQMNRFRFLYAALFLLQVIAVYLNGTRGVWLALLIVLIVALFTPRSLTLRRRVMYFTLLVIAGIAIFHGTYFQAKWASLKGQIERYPNIEFGSSYGERLEMIIASGKMFLQNPVFGVGLGGWKREWLKIIEHKETASLLSQYNQTHNIYLDVLSTRGIFGFVAFMAVIIYPIVFAWKSRSKDDELFRTLLILSGVAFLVSGATDTLIYIRWVFMSYILLTGLCLAVLLAERPVHYSDDVVYQKQGADIVPANLKIDY